jgi:hypothetical protein
MIRSVALAIVLLGVSAVVMADVCLVGNILFKAIIAILRSNQTYYAHWLVWLCCDSN